MPINTTLKIIFVLYIINNSVIAETIVNKLNVDNINASSTTSNITIEDLKVDMLREIRKAKRRNLSSQLKNPIKVRGPNYSGGWNGKFVLRRDDCDLVNSSMLFRHIIQYGRSNNVRIGTTHDGTLYGSSRNKGNRIEVIRNYDMNGVNLDVGLIYDKLNSKRGVAVAVLGVVASADGDSCPFVYSANSIKAF